MKERTITIKGKTIAVSEEIYKLFSQEREKERFYNKKKREKIIVDNDEYTVTFEESKMDSLNRLQERNVQIADKSRSVEDYITAKVDLERALEKLTSKERYIIEEYYFYQRTETEIAIRRSLKNF